MNNLDIVYKIIKGPSFEESGIHTIGIAGLGLIGGSFAKAFKSNCDARVLVFDLDSSVTDEVINDGFADGILTDDMIPECDLIIPALYNQAVIDYVGHIAPLVKKSAIVIDTGGLKRSICEECYKIADEYGFTFVGGHPMAGKKYSGYKYSSANLFKDASMIVCPKDKDDYSLLEHLKDVFSPCGYGRLTVCSAEVHDSMIAFTSDLAHIVSNAYVKSPTASKHRGFSAGSYKDLTRVAWLNEDMWTEIFMENKDNIIQELDYIIANLEEYKNAMEQDDPETLRTLLRDGKLAKERIDGK